MSVDCLEVPNGQKIKIKKIKQSISKNSQNLL